MVQEKKDKSKKVNIRKAVLYNRMEQKNRYKILTGGAIDGSYSDAQRMRAEEQLAWDKFKFLSNLQEALDKVDK